MVFFTPKEIFDTCADKYQVILLVLHPLREILEVSILEFGNSDLEEELGVKECERK